jgi:hypothetical protein
MKISLLLISAFFISFGTFAQTAGPNDPGAAATVPSSACLACPGSIWNSETTIFLQDNTSAFVSLEPNGTCFQSSCYRSRYLYASNFGFNIPVTASITGITAEIYRQSGNTNSAADSTVKLVQNSMPMGANRAISTAWPLTGAYYTYGSASDLWGLAWAPADINDPAFGLYLKVYNMDANVTTTPSVDHIRITVDYQLPSGIHSSQTSEPSIFHVYQQEEQVQVTMMVTGTINYGTIELYDVLGDLRCKKEVSNVPSGMYSTTLSAEGLKSGIYFIRFAADDRLFTKKIFIQN